MKERAATVVGLISSVTTLFFQAVRVSLKQGATTLELRPENKVTVAQLRTVIRNNGFVPKRHSGVSSRDRPR